MSDATQLSEGRSFVRLLTGNWPSIATVVALVAAAVAWMALSAGSSLEAMGSYISGVVSAITLLWLAIGQKNQLAELSLQRQELALQRAAAQQQALELHNAARIAAMTQIQSLVDDAVELVRVSGLVKSETELLSLYLSGIKYWKDLEESKDPSHVIAISNEWIKIEGVCKRYLNTIAAAMRLYQEFNNPNYKIPTDKDSDEVVYISTMGEVGPFYIRPNRRFCDARTICYVDETGLGACFACVDGCPCQIGWSGHVLRYQAKRNAG